MKMRKISLVLSTIGVFSLVGCDSGTKTLDLNSNKPVYENDSTEFVTFGYSSPTDGSYNENNVQKHVKDNNGNDVDFRTVERYREYKESGLNTMMIQRNDPYNGEDWETSQLKKNMDMTQEAGISRCIVFDSRIQSLSDKTIKIVGEGCLYETQEDLEAFVENCMKDYSKHPVFYGVMLRDEPTYQYFDAYCAVYKAIKKVAPNCYIESNLLPLTNSDSDQSRYSPNYLVETMDESYQYYLNKFIELANPDKILMDSYPFRADGKTDSVINAAYFRGNQIIADTCKEHGIKFEAVAQSFAATNVGTRKFVKPTISCLEYQMNSYIACGVQTLGYFTYWRKQNNSLSGEWFEDGASFITQEGEKTDIYYGAQTVLGEMQKFAPVISKFKYQQCGGFVEAPFAGNSGYISSVETKDFACFKTSDYSAQTGTAAFITELKDETNNQYMYMVMNAMNPLNKSTNKDYNLNYSINFGSEYNAVEVYYRGEMHLEELVNGVYSSSLDCGYADYIMPYKA